jgi:hypothetical protein
MDYFLQNSCGRVYLMAAEDDLPPKRVYAHSLLWMYKDKAEEIKEVATLMLGYAAGEPATSEMKWQWVKWDDSDDLVVMFSWKDNNKLGFPITPGINALTDYRKETIAEFARCLREIAQDILEYRVKTYEVVEAV